MDDALSLWMALEDAAGASLGPPFFCVAWPGAQALAHAVMKGAVAVSGRRVLDVGCGSGLAAVACAMAGAKVVAVDVDPLACLAASLLAERHGLKIAVAALDALACFEIGRAFDVVLAGDVVYSREAARRLAHAVSDWQGHGARVVLADSGRPFFSPSGLPLLLEATVPVPAGVEGKDERTVRVYALPSPSG